MIKIPYGKSNFKEVISGKFFYQDRTNYIKILEDFDSSYLIYLRPRRFGKSLMVSALKHYYGLQYKDEFNALFGNLFIGKNPTPLANQYLVLTFEFSGIDTSTAKSTMEGFLTNVHYWINDFLVQYDMFFTPEQRDMILSKKQPNTMLKALLSCYMSNKISHKIYILVDEYDHFANELISFDFNFFAKSVTENGFVRKFYETIKTATWQGIVERLFITGVSPVTLDSMTSGFNIGTNISLRPAFHAMMGFEEIEVQGLLRAIGIKKNELAPILTDLRAWYDGYLFNINAKKHVYNTDMVLYFASYYQSEKKYPDNLLDSNIASDYSKIRNIFKIQQKEENHLNTLRSLSDRGEITAILTTEFSLKKEFEQDDLVSLLFYMGFLTIRGSELGSLVFSFPNYVIEKLYADYFISIIRQQGDLPIDNSELNAALRELANWGNPQYLYNQVSEIVKVLSTRDAKDFNEMSLKAIFVSLLHQQKFFFVHSEYETERQYVDVFLETIRGYKVKYEVAFELKYIKKAETINVDTELKKAEIQLMNYMVTKKFIQRPNLKAFVVLVHGTELHQKEMIL
jgi:Predicted AAA-ATPase/PD-(D/E)XK nuclease superfamily